MKTLVLLKTVGAFFLAFAAFHVAGYVFGWTQFRQEDWFPLIIGGVSGGAAAVVVVRHLNAKKRAAARQP
jgi:hypothetical protein